MSPCRLSILISCVYSYQQGKHPRHQTCLLLSSSLVHAHTLSFLLCFFQLRPRYRHLLLQSTDTSYIDITPRNLEFPTWQRGTRHPPHHYLASPRPPRLPRPPRPCPISWRPEAANPSSSSWTPSCPTNPPITIISPSTMAPRLGRGDLRLCRSSSSIEFVAVGWACCCASRPWC